MNLFRIRLICVNNSSVVFISLTLEYSLLLLLSIIIQITRMIRVWILKIITVIYVILLQGVQLIFSFLTVLIFKERLS